MCAYDLKDFTRIELPEMIRNRTDFTSVAIGNYIYVLGGSEMNNGVYDPARPRYDYYPILGGLGSIYADPVMEDNVINDRVSVSLHDLRSYERFVYDFNSVSSDMRVCVLEI